MPEGSKKLSYRVQGSTSQEAAQAHWAGFTWTGGRVQVIYRGPWGSIQCWAASEDEGRRVIGHACAHAGISTTDPAGFWSANEVSGGRWRQGVTYRTKVRFGVPVVTARAGPGGPPILDIDP
jgi:hypothetical protein